MRQTRCNAKFLQYGLDDKYIYIYKYTLKPESPTFLRFPHSLLSYPHASLTSLYKQQTEYILTYGVLQLTKIYQLILTRFIFYFLRKFNF